MPISSENDDNVMDFPNSPPARTALEHEEDGMAIASAIINMSVRVLNARLMWILALLGAIGMWAMASYSPESGRLWAAAGYSIGVLVPVMLFTSKKG